MGKEEYQKFGWIHHFYFQVLTNIFSNTSLKQIAWWQIFDLEDYYTAAEEWKNEGVKSLNLEFHAFYFSVSESELSSLIRIKETLHLKFTCQEILWDKSDI